jgi:uncharacterized membrane protein YidH (DUF202 family)
MALDRFKTFIKQLTQSSLMNFKFFRLNIEIFFLSTSIAEKVATTKSKQKCIRVFQEIF